jgi:hypothetical protein
VEWNYRVSTGYTSSIPLRALITRTTLKGVPLTRKTVAGITCVGVGVLQRTIPPAMHATPAINRGQ